MKTNWQSHVHALSEKRHRKTVEEFEKERKSLLDLVEEKSSQLEAALNLASGKIHPTKVKITDSPKSEATVVAVASDWHVEETVDPKTINGLNEFNLDIAERRIKAFWKNVVKLTEMQRHGVKVDNLVLILGGDMMTGYIHEELQESNGLSPTQTVLWLQDQIAGGIQFLSKHFEKIDIPCAMGNHGRCTKKPRHSTAAANSYEWMMYHILKKQLSSYANWHIADGYHLMLDVYGKTLRIHHGDGLKYQGGIGGLTIPVEKAIASWNKGIPADLDIFGHWHQSQQNPKWIANGSLIGFNAYSVAIKAAYEPPSQTLFMFDKRHGRTGTFPVFLD